MLVSKWGDGLAVRLSEEDVARLGLKEGDEVEVKRAESPVMPAETQDQGEVSPDEWVMRMRRFRGILPADFKFNRDEANER
jgi:antitoxin MazE